MSDYITGIAPTKFDYWIEWALLQIQESFDVLKLGVECPPFKAGLCGWSENDYFIAWCQKYSDVQGQSFSMDYSTKLAIRGWCNRCIESIKASGGDPDAFPWLIAAQNMEFEPLTFPGATNGVWHGDEPAEKVGFDKFRELFGGGE